MGQRQNLSVGTRLSIILTAGMLSGMVGPLTSTLPGNVFVKVGGYHNSVTHCNLYKPSRQYGKGHPVLKGKEFSCVHASDAMLCHATCPDT